MGTTVDKLNKLLETKADIKAAIVEKGQTVSDSDTFASYGDKIRAIESGSEPNLQAKTVTPTGQEIVVTADEVSVREGYALYNGAESLNIDSVWTDKTTYPYAILRGPSCLYLLTEIPYINPAGKVMWGKPVKLSWYSLGFSGGLYQWNAVDNFIDVSMNSNSYSLWTVSSSDPLTWASINIFNEDGSVYLAASDPVTAPYTGLGSVTIEGDPNLVPENIAKDITIYGVTGTFEGESGNVIPEPYATYIEEAKAVYTGEYANVIYAEGYGDITGVTYHTVMFLLDTWTISAYNAATTAYTHSGFYMVQKEDDGEWTLTDYSTTSTDTHYAKNIKAASMYIEFNDITLFPVGQSGAGSGQDAGISGIRMTAQAKAGHDRTVSITMPNFQVTVTGTLEE